MKRFSLLFLSISFSMIIIFSINAATHVDPYMPVPYDVVLSSDGEVTWNIDDSAFVPDPDDPTSTIERHYIYKKFYIKLQKRYAEYISGTASYEYQWRDFGSEKAINVTGDDSHEYYGSVEVSSPGLYAVKVRAYSAENAYSDWSAVSAEAAFDSSTTNINITQGSSVSSNYGPGTVYSGSNGMNVTSPYQQNSNYGNATNIIGVNGQYINSNGMGSAYIYDNKYQNNINYQGTSTANIGVGPGYNNGQTQEQMAAGPGINSQVITYNNNAIQSPNFNLYTTNTNQIVQSGPSQSGSNASGGIGTNQQYWSKEIGWHRDNVGFYYYNGNGEYLRDKWYFIDNYYYRFDTSCYAMISKWFKDPTNNCWYFLGAEGKMLTGWQNIQGIWYYLNPDRGTNFGVMYSNCSMNIGGKYYAFDSEGGCIMNNYYNGYYYGYDGARQ